MYNSPSRSQSAYGLHPGMTTHLSLLEMPSLRSGTESRSPREALRMWHSRLLNLMRRLVYHSHLEWQDNAAGFIEMLWPKVRKWKHLTSIHPCQSTCKLHIRTHSSSLSACSWHRWRLVADFHYGTWILKICIVLRVWVRIKLSAMAPIVTARGFFAHLYLEECRALRLLTIFLLPRSLSAI